MKNESKIHKSKRAIEIQDSIRQVLFNEWDPIGINDNPNLVDEYDAYVAPIYRILVESRSEDELVNFLFSTERDIIRVSCESPKQLRPIAQELLMLDVRL